MQQRVAVRLVGCAADHTRSPLDREAIARRGDLSAELLRLSGTLAADQQARRASWTPRSPKVQAGSCRLAPRTRRRRGAALLAEAEDLALDELEATDVRIAGWHIDGFGVFSDYASPELPDGLTVFTGPNEAGKSTLLAFIRGVLFGFPNKRRHLPLYAPCAGAATAAACSWSARTGATS